MTRLRRDEEVERHAIGVLQNEWELIRRNKNYRRRYKWLQTVVTKYLPATPTDDIPEPIMHVVRRMERYFKIRYPLPPDYSSITCGKRQERKIYGDGRFALYHLLRFTSADIKEHYSEDVLMRLCFSQQTPGVKGNRLFFNTPRPRDPDAEIVAPIPEDFDNPYILELELDIRQRKDVILKYIDGRIENQKCWLRKNKLPCPPRAGSWFEQSLRVYDLIEKGMDADDVRNELFRSCPNVTEENIIEKYEAIKDRISSKYQDQREGAHF